MSAIAQDERESARLASEAAEARLAEYEATLRSRDPAQWTTRQLELYYKYALEVIQLGIEQQYASNRRHLYELAMYRNIGWIGKWPLNPLDNWNPLPILEPEDSHIPGGLVWQLCPPEAYSLEEYEGRYYTRRDSYELSICGPDGRTPASATPLAGNRDWAVVPPGTLAMVGRHEPSFYETAGRDADLDELLQDSTEHWENWRDTLVFCRNFDYPEGFDYRAEFRFVYSVTALLRAKDDLRQLKRELQTNAGDQVDDQLVADYLEQVCWLVYSCESLYQQLYDTYTRDPGELVRAGLLEAVPPNPLDGWRATRILRLTDGYMPGELFMQTCDPCYFSSGGTGPRPWSFQIGVYGPPVLLNEPVDISAQGMNADWAVVPDGTLQYIGSFGQSLLQSDYRRAVCFM